MRYVQLPGIGTPCSALGFGCANLMGRVSRRQSLRALAAAFDHGVTVFDTARSYGWGESEAVLGEFTRGRRNRLVIMTKFGILPPARNRFRQALKPVVRGLLNFAGRFRLATMTAAIRAEIGQRVSSQVQSGQFDIETARRSVHDSLRALRTDYLDVLFLHGVQYSLIGDGRVLGFLEELVRAGKVRTVGAATGVEDVNRILSTFPLVRIAQLENNLMVPQLDALDRGTERGVITNRPFGGRSVADQLMELLHAAPVETGRWSTQTGIDLHGSAGIGHLLLSYAFAANPLGIVLCGMHKAEHIAENVAAASMPPRVDDAFRQVVGEIREGVGALSRLSALEQTE